MNLNILKKAKIIVFPIAKNSNYIKIDKIKNCNFLPITGEVYSKYEKNKHHYTTKYHRRYVLPLLNKLFSFGLKFDDFKKISNIITKNGKKSI